MKKSNSAYGILLAAGQSRRMASLGSKMWLTLRGRPVLAWALERFARVAGPGVVVAQSGEQDAVQTVLDEAGLGQDWMVTEGGAERYESVRRGLLALTKRRPAPSGQDLVLIHDAARCLLPADVGERVVRALERHSAVIPALPVTDTVKRRAVGDGLLAGTVPRDDLLLAQTPQGFHWEVVDQAYRRWRVGVPTDDAEVVAAAGTWVAWVAGDPGNRKLTTPDDVAWFEWQLAREGGS
ncbi:MAG: IspD/TarI family cytidylyltransferase [Thermaerobacter sp.]|nr:IspD/TarI family cytidylyltransferase [Thermaerobacter sp.]